MSDLDTIAKLLLEIETLKVHLAQMKRHHLQVLCTITYGLGGELRITQYDYVHVPPGTVLEVMTDPVTGDTIFRTQAPEHEQDAPLLTQ